MPVAALILAGCLGGSDPGSAEGRWLAESVDCPPYPDGTANPCVDEAVPLMESGQPSGLGWVCQKDVRAPDGRFTLYYNVLTEEWGLQYRDITVGNITGGVIVINGRDGTRILTWQSSGSGFVSHPRQEGDYDIGIRMFHLSAEWHDPPLGPAEVASSWSVYNDRPWAVFAVTGPGAAPYYFQFFANFTWTFSSGASHEWSSYHGGRAIGNDFDVSVEYRTTGRGGFGVGLVGLGCTL